MRAFIPNQIFVGLPWKNVKSKYERVITKLAKRSPLSFIIVGRGDTQEAQELLSVIKQKLENSSWAIFDATGGNANVSLEYGYAEAKNIPRVLYLSAHKATARSKEGTIISDLAGKRRHHYTNEKTLFTLLHSFSNSHSYTKRYEKALGQEMRRFSKGDKKSMRATALRVIHLLDNESDVRRDDMVQKLLGLDYSQWEIDDTLKRLHRRKLIHVERGRYSSVSVA